MPDGQIGGVIAPPHRLAQAPAVWHDSPMLWSPDIDIIAGGLGMSFALCSIRRRQLGKPVHPDAAKADGWLLVLAAALVCIGVARWPG